jgi:hypothetical protein
MPYSDVIGIFGADEDTSVAPYDEILSATVAGFSGVSSMSVRVYAPGRLMELEGDETRYANGEIRGALDMRQAFNVEVVPFTYKASAWDENDYNSLCTLLRKPFKWLQLNQWADAFDRGVDYHGALSVIPVELLEMSSGIDKQRGLITLELVFKKVWNE